MVSDKPPEEGVGNQVAEVKEDVAKLKEDISEVKVNLNLLLQHFLTNTNWGKINFCSAHPVPVIEFYYV